MQKNIQDYIIDVHSCDPHSSNAYKQDLFDVLNEDFTKEYEFIDSPTLDDMVKHKQSDEVFKVFYKKDDKVYQKEQLELAEAGINDGLEED
ncbi:TPA: hypothetical protein R8U92_001696 [Campylobacter jejuni]|nr:hypothetical protein [Campylobacter jejuni]HEF1747650.1 hypothetical protein [Campylobacter jejuni]